MKKVKVAAGVYWLEVPEADLNILCGCPADSVKLLKKKGLIVSEEKSGVVCETGPNAILLSDISIQKARFSNLAEFPVLQILYFQGMILPGHPNNTGAKPLLIGAKDQLKAQAEYIYRGNYGLSSEEEIIDSGIPAEQAREMMRLKLKFAFDRMVKTEDLLDLLAVTTRRKEIKNGVFVRRKKTNIFQFTFKDQSIDINLNLKPGEQYEAPYPLDYHVPQREYFSVVHVGEGDGWDCNRPCMGSYLTFQGRIYLIDAGPNIIYSLTAMGLSANDIEGIFHTHAHDDHFAGLTALFRTDKRIKHYTTPLVRASVIKKLSALMSIEEGSFEKYFEICNLEFDQWNNVNGLEVKPIFSPHPIETNIMLFRALWEDGYRTYAHWADIVSLDILSGMITDDPSQNGVSQEFFDTIKNAYLTPVNLKKIDIGGGLIHGNAEDFAEDRSDKIILSHTAHPLNKAQKEIGGSASFGVADVLIEASQDYTKAIASKHLHSYFPTVPKCDIRILLNCPETFFNAGEILVKRNRINENIYYILSGVIEFIQSSQEIQNTLSTGSMAGELSGLMRTAPRGTYRAVSNVKALRISSEMYIEFVKRNGIYDVIKQDIEKRHFLQGTALFGEMVSCPIINKIIKTWKEYDYKKGQRLSSKAGQALFLLENGGIDITYDDLLIEKLSEGDFYGTENILFGSSPLFQARTNQPSKLFIIDRKLIMDIPIVQWKLTETYERRMKELNTLIS